MSEARLVAVEELLAESDWVRRLARALVRDPDAAEDVTQQTLVAALERPPKADRPLRPWLRVVVENFARMRLRSEGARAKREEQVARREADSSTEAAYERVEMQRTLASDVLALEEPFREAVVLHYYAGLTSVEIARRTGSPEGTIRWRLKRGLEQLRERLDRRHGGDRSVWLSALASWCHEPEASLATGSFGTLLALAALLALGIGVFLFAGRRAAEPDGLAVAAPEAPALEPSPEQGSAEARAAPEANTEVRTERGGRRLRARLVDSQGWPVAGALASVGASTARSDELGELALALSPDISRSSHLTLELAADGFVRERLDFVAPRDGTLEFGELRLDRSATLEGRIVDRRQRHVEGAWVRVEALGSRWSRLEPHPVEEARYMGSLLPDDAPKGSVDASGRFRIEGLRAGYVRLWFGAEGHEVQWADERALHAGRTSDAGVLELAPLDERTCIMGRVLDPQGQPLAGALVECARQSLRQPLFRNHDKARRTVADELGRFVLWVEPNSRYHVGAADPFQRHRSVAQGTFAAGDHHLELRLSQWRPLEVLVLDAGAQPLAGARIELVDSGRGDTLERESKEWNAGRHVAPWCDFELLVHAPGCLVERLGPFRAEDSPAHVVARPKVAPQVRGHVRIDGLAAGDASVELALAAEPDRGSVSVREPGFEPFHARVAVDAARRSVRSAADGSFELAVPPARAFFVRAAHPGRAAATLGPYTLQQGETLELAFDLPRGGAILGQVVRGDGKSAAGTLVGISRGDGLVATCRTDAAGRFEFRALEPGDWQVRRVAREALEFEPLPLAPGGPAAPRWDVTVLEGRDTPFELHVDEMRRTRLVGALRFDGQSAGPWGVEARLGAQRVTDVLDPEGRFELDLPREGDWALAARWAPRGGDEFEYSEPLARWSGQLAVERDWPSCAMEVEVGPDHAGEAVSVILLGPGGARLAIHTLVDAEGVARFSRMPSGALRIELEDGDSVDCTVSPNERRKLIWPRR